MELHSPLRRHFLSPPHRLLLLNCSQLLSTAQPQDQSQHMGYNGYKLSFVGDSQHPDLGQRLSKLALDDPMVAKPEAGDTKQGANSGQGSGLRGKGTGLEATPLAPVLTLPSIVTQT